MGLEVISQENLCSCSACRGIRLHVESKPGDDTTLHEEWERAAFMVSTATELQSSQRRSTVSSPDHVPSQNHIKNKLT